MSPSRAQRQAHLSPPVSCPRHHRVWPATTVELNEPDPLSSSSVVAGYASPAPLVGPSPPWSSVELDPPQWTQWIHIHLCQARWSPTHHRASSVVARSASLAPMVLAPAATRAWERERERRCYRSGSREGKALSLPLSGRGRCVTATMGEGCHALHPTMGEREPVLMWGRERH
jgi:hypothetical protein